MLNVTVIISIMALLISACTFFVAYSQMRISSAKTKLDLYNKRFLVYVSALEYYQVFWDKSAINNLAKIDEKSRAFVRAYREAQFLFDVESGVYGLLGKINQNGSHMYAYLKYKYEHENNLTKDVLDLRQLHDDSINAGMDFERNLLSLEEKIKPYLYFENVNGWHLFMSKK